MSRLNMPASRLRMPSRKSLSLYTVTFALFFSLGAALNTTQSTVQSWGLAHNNPPRLYFFLPSSKKALAGKILPVKVYLDSGSQTVNNANLIISFDPTLAELKANPVPGPAFTNSSNTLTAPDSGVIEWRSYGKHKGAESVLSFKLKLKQKGELKINLDYATVNGQAVATQPAILQIE